MKYKALRSVLCGMALASIASIWASAAFTKTLTYQGNFTDVTENDWFAANVADVYELGFMKGTSDTAFSPNDPVTVAEGITMASRIHAIYQDTAAPVPGDGNWYDAYVAYCIANGIITDGQYDDYERPMTRWEMASVFCDALPNDYFPNVNAVDAIPDVNEKAPYAEKLLKLYRAGIVMGSDAYGTFNPDASIKRSECAAIIGRVALPDKRLNKTLAARNERDAYMLAEVTKYTNYVSTQTSNTVDNLPSGWTLDNRGGTPRRSIESDLVALIDISDKEPTALVRTFNPIFDDVITAEFAVTPYNEGALCAFRDVNGKTLYEVKIAGTSWGILQADGSYQNAADVKLGEKALFKITLDLPNKTAKTVIDGNDCGTSALLSDSLIDFRFAFDEKSTGTLTPGNVYMYANYPMYQHFDLFDASSVYGWTLEGGAKPGDDKDLLLDGASSASYAFAPVDGKFVASTYFLLPNGEDISYDVLASGYTAISVKTVSGALYVDDVKVADVKRDMWHRLRLEANPSLESVDVRLNGRIIATVPMALAMPVDGVKVTSADGAAKFDYMEVFPVVDHPDYCPAPTNNARLDDYTVMVNICSLWRENSESYGWAVISPFDDNRPVLGFYDEGVPEMADWEIKYMVEHGIDVQAFCWFNSESNGPIKRPDHSSQLHDGFMNAKYSDSMKYVLLLELQASKAFDAEQFENYVVPYLFENYFLDDRYLKIDNKIVIHSYGSALLGQEKFFGSEYAAKKELKYLDEMAQVYGFDGIIFTSTNVTPYIDGYAAYSWSTNGFSYDHNVKSNLDMYKQGQEAKNPFYAIPTVSVGYNLVAWSNIRSPMMSVEDFKKTNAWVRDSYIPEHANANDWTRNVVMLSTWNEFGEGTYICPAGLNGFGYLDAVRGVYTDLPADHEDIIPDDEQLARITHLYPQGQRTLARERKVDYDNGEEAAESLAVLATYEINEDTIKTSCSNDVVYTDGGVSAVAGEQGDPFIQFTALDGTIDLSKVSKLRFTMKGVKGMTGQIFFGTSKDDNLDEAKSYHFPVNSDEETEYVIDVSGNNAWMGYLLTLRIDPFNLAGKEYYISNVEFLGEEETDENAVPHGLVVNTMKIESEVPSDTLDDGRVLYPFDPQTAVHYIMNANMKWDKAAGALTLEANGHTVTFTVGKDTYTADGKEANLGYKVYLKDGLPMIDFAALAKALGFECSADGEDIEIKAAMYDVYFEASHHELGTWDFNTYDTEGWTSPHFDLTVNDGYMHCVSKDEYNDPVIRLEHIEIPAKKYLGAEIRLRFSYTRDSESLLDHADFFYLTDKDGQWNEAKKLYSEDFKTNDTGSDWITITLKPRSESAWANVITDLRFDPFNAHGYVDIDYIHFIPNPDYDPEAEERAAHTISNGDAEDTGYVAFRALNGGTVTIEEDSTKAGNHVYRVIGTPGHTWTYFCQDYSFQKGKTYNISFDARALPDSNGDNVDQKLVINMQYPDKNGSLQNGTGRDHLMQDKTLVLPADGTWMHFEASYTVRTMDVQNTGVFSMYIDPPTDTSSGNFEIDNVSVLPEE